MHMVGTDSLFLKAEGIKPLTGGVPVSKRVLPDQKGRLNFFVESILIYGEKLEKSDKRNLETGWRRSKVHSAGFEDDVKVVTWMVHRHGVAAIPGTACGAPGSLRSFLILLC